MLLPRTTILEKHAQFFVVVVMVILGKSEWGRGSKELGQIGYGFKIESETSSHSIDLSNMAHNICLNHRHKGKLPMGPKYTLTIKPDLKSECFILYNDYNCQGARLKFHKVTRARVLKLDREAVDKYGVEKLLNYDIAPNSVSQCQSPTSFPEGGTCGSNYALNVGRSNGIEITKDTCFDIPPFKENDYRENMGEIFLNMIPPSTRHYDYDYHEHGHEEDEGQICIETYSQYGCAGDMIQYIISAPFTPADQAIIKNPMIRLWHFHQGKSFTPNAIDTYIKSVKRCPCDHHPHPLPGPSELTPEKNGDIDEDMTIGSAIEGESKLCHFPGCKSIETFVKIGNETNQENCFFIFNKSDCNEQPIFQRKSIDKIELVNLTNQYEEFSNWTIADCNDHGEVDQSCLAPVKTVEKIEDVLSLFLESTQSKYTEPAKKETIFNKVEMIVLIVASVVAFVMLAIVLILGLLLWRNKRRVRQIRKGTRKIPKHRLVNQGSGAGTSGGLGGGIHQIDPIEQNDYVNDITGLQALCKYFENGGYEIPREHINIGNIRDSSAHIIGVGEFSIAFKGILEPQSRTVAVKTMKSGHGTASAMKRVLKECKFFVDCGKHERIVEFLGVCTEKMRSGEIFVVMAFCENGPLKSFLVQHRAHFLSLVKDGEMNENEDLKAYAERSIEEGPPPKYNTFQLFKWCLEMADAMEYLATRKIVHSSLCSRNVLLDADFKTKLCDFHLARLPGEGASANVGSRLNMNKERSIPWRFYAVESLLDDIFSTESDVWTFGIFMWELFTLGATPYPEQIYGGEFTMTLKHGYRLLKPELATIEIYELMLICWYDAPEKRPTFTKLKAKLERMINCS